VAARRQRDFRWLLAGLAIFLLLVLFGLLRWRGTREHSQDGVILAAALRHNIHPALIKAVVWRESYFDPRARGTSGELGLMQIREPTARDWAAAEKISWPGHSVLLDPARNTQCGAWYLRRLLNRYRQADNPLAYALAAYNAGPTHVARWSQGEGATNAVRMLEQMDFPGTRRYVGAVSRRYEYYRRRFPPKGWEQAVADRPHLIEGINASPK
jgi:soluble lytic murein transglycosylase